MSNDCLINIIVDGVLMKKILILSAFMPCNQTAGQNYTLNLISHLSQKFTIDLMFFHNINDKKYLKKISGCHIIGEYHISRKNKVYNVFKLPFLHPFFTCRFFFRIVNHINKISKEYDYIYFDFSQVMLYSIFIIHKSKICMLHDVVSQKYKRKVGILSRINWIFCFISEYIIVRLSGAQIFCFSRKDVDLVGRYFNKKANRVDFFIDKDIVSIHQKISDFGDYFVFFGAWARPENSEGLEWFFDHVYSLLDMPIKIKIIGGGLSVHLQKKIKNYANVKYVGFLANPYPSIANSKGLIAPLFQGAGVKVKVVESLAVGTPVVGTSVAFEGIEFLDKKCLHLVEHPNEFVSAIKLLSSNIEFIDKKSLRESFLRNYPKYSFMQYIS